MWTLIKQNYMQDQQLGTIFVQLMSTFPEESTGPSLIYPPGEDMMNLMECLK